MIRFCSVFMAVLLFTATAWAQPVNTSAIEGSQSVLSQMTWLPDPHKSIDYATASSAETQARFQSLAEGFALQSTGPGWLRLELAKNDQQSSPTPSRVDKKSLYLNFSFLPSGKATLYKTGSFSSQPGARHKPLATRIYPFQTERLADPSISNAVYYIQLDETPGLWFNPTLSRTDTKSPILPHDLLLPSILLACLAFSLLRLAIDRTAWPVWAAAILICVIIELLLPIPVAFKSLKFGDLPVLLAPGIAIMIYAHLGRLLLNTPQNFPQGDTFLRLYPVAGAVAALAPLLPQCYWLTRLFPLWGLLLIPLLAVATSALFRQLKGGLAYFVATFMPVLGACIALYGIFSPGIDMLAETGTFWGVAIGSFALIFARSAQTSSKTQSEQNKQGDPKEQKQPHNKKGHSHPDFPARLPLQDEHVISHSVGQDTDTALSANEAGLDKAVAQNNKVAPLLITPLTMSGGATSSGLLNNGPRNNTPEDGEPNDIFASLQYADLSGKGQQYLDESGNNLPKDNHTVSLGIDPMPSAQNKDTPLSMGHSQTRAKTAQQPADASHDEPLASLSMHSADAPAGVTTPEGASDNTFGTLLGSEPDNVRDNVPDNMFGNTQSSASPAKDRTTSTEDHDNEDILELRTLARQPLAEVELPDLAASQQKTHPAKTDPRKVSPKSPLLDWPESTEDANFSSMPVDIFSPEANQPIADPLLSLQAKTMSSNENGPHPKALEETDTTGKASSSESHSPSTPDISDEQGAKTLTSLDIPAESDLSGPTTGPTTGPNDISQQDEPNKHGAPAEEESTMLIHATSETRAAPLQRQDSESRSRIIPESAHIIRLSDESLANDIPESATQKVDAVLASVGGFKAAESLESPLNAKDLKARSTETFETDNTVTPDKDDTNENDLIAETDSIVDAGIGVESPTFADTATPEKAATQFLADQLPDGTAEPRKERPSEVTTSEPALNNQTNQAHQAHQGSHAESAKIADDIKSGFSPVSNETAGADNDPVTAEAASLEVAPFHQPVQPVQSAQSALSELSPATEQAARERAYIETLLSTEGKHSLPEEDKPFPISAVKARYLQTHSEKEQKVLESYDGHCIIITEMTTSNKRLLQSYFNEMGIPCVEAQNLGETTTVQAITGAPLVIYDADSPADAIIKSIQQLNEVPTPPRYLVLTSVVSQGKLLVEQGATRAITKPFTKESLFSAAHALAPTLFPHGEPFQSQPTHEDRGGMSGSTVTPAPPKDNHRRSVVGLSSSEEAYIEELFGGHQRTQRKQTTPDNLAGKAHEQRVDDLLAQLNGEEAVPSSDTLSSGTLSSGTLSSEEQTASVISKMLSVDSPDSLHSPNSTDMRKGIASQKDSDPATQADTAREGLPLATPAHGTSEYAVAGEREDTTTVSASNATHSVNTPHSDTSSPARAKDSLLDFIVAEDEEIAMDYPPATTSHPSSPVSNAETEGMQPLADFEGEFIEQLMLPLIPGLLYALKDGLRDAEAGLGEKHLFAVQEAVSSMTSKAETFGLKKLEKIGQCVLRATNANDAEATTTLMEDLGNITKRYIAALEKSYDDYIQASRPS